MLQKVAGNVLRSSNLKLQTSDGDQSYYSYTKNVPFDRRGLGAFLKGNAALESRKKCLVCT